MKTFYTRDELKTLRIKQYGEDVLIGRNAILYHPELLVLGNHVRIDDFTTISGKVVLGNYIHIAQFCSLYGGTSGIQMDDFSGLSSHVAVYATSNDYSGKSMTNPMVPEKYKPTDRNLPVHIQKHVVIGCMSVVLPGVTIEEGCAVGAMSLCNKKMPSWGIYAGIPCARVKERSKEILELEKMFDTEQMGGVTQHSNNCIRVPIFMRGLAA